MIRDHAHRFFVWAQCGQCLLFCALSACTIDRAGQHAALQQTHPSGASEMSDASLPGPDASHDASLVLGDASDWPVRDAEGSASDAAVPAFDAGQPEAGADASLPDLCPSDDEKTADKDSDGDDILDCNDECPLDPKKIASGICGCGNAEPDGSKRTLGRRGATCPAP